MAFIGKNPLVAPKISTPLTPPTGTRGLFPQSDGWYDIDDTGHISRIGGGGSDSPITIDTSLLIEGAAADAYTTGEAINAVANETYRLNRLGVFYWLPNTNYRIDNIVVVDNGSAHKIFKCIESHISSDEFYKDDNFWEIVTPIHVELAIQAERDSDGNYITNTYATKEELNDGLGDIDAALDNIIALQEQYIGYAIQTTAEDGDSV